MSRGILPVKDDPLRRRNTEPLKRQGWQPRPVAAVPDQEMGDLPTPPLGLANQFACHVEAAAGSS